jgi:hypothetical protein
VNVPIVTCRDHSQVQTFEGSAARESFLVTFLDRKQRPLSD